MWFWYRFTGFYSFQPNMSKSKFFLINFQCGTNTLLITPVYAGRAPKTLGTEFCWLQNQWGVQLLYLNTHRCHNICDRFTGTAKLPVSQTHAHAVPPHCSSKWQDNEQWTTETFLWLYFSGNRNHQSSGANGCFTDCWQHESPREVTFRFESGVFITSCYFSSETKFKFLWICRCHFLFWWF